MCSKLVEITEEQFPLQKEIQTLTEAIPQEIFELNFVRSEVEINLFELHYVLF
jgi:hypothetical protein